MTQPEHKGGLSALEDFKALAAAILQANTKKKKKYAVEDASQRNGRNWYTDVVSWCDCCTGTLVHRHNGKYHALDPCVEMACS